MFCLNAFIYFNILIFLTSCVSSQKDVLNENRFYTYNLSIKQEDKLKCKNNNAFVYLYPSIKKSDIHKSKIEMIGSCKFILVNIMDDKRNHIKDIKVPIKKFYAFADSFFCRNKSNTSGILGACSISREAVSALIMISDSNINNAFLLSDIDNYNTKIISKKEFKRLDIDIFNFKYPKIDLTKQVEGWLNYLVSAAIYEDIK